jgi:hypothetical protein
MSITTFGDVAVEPSVIEFLKRHGAEGEFQGVLEVARECFPQWCAAEAYLQEDPDVDNRWQVILHITLPESYSLDDVQELHRRSAERLVALLPPERFPDPVCTLIFGFA